MNNLFTYLDKVARIELANKNCPKCHGKGRYMNLQANGIVTRWCNCYKENKTKGGDNS